MSEATSGAALAPSRMSLRSSGLRTDLPYAQAQLDAAACDMMARRANHQKPVESLARKYSAFVLTQISRITLPVSRQMRGVGHRHERAVRCDGREWRETYVPEAYGEVVWFGRRGAGVKLAIRSAGDGGKRAVLREEHEVSRKAIAQGRPECSRCPVCSCALLFAQIARETAGAASTRSSLRPLFRRGPKEDAKTSDAMRRENAKSYSNRSPDERSDIRGPL